MTTLGHHIFRGRRLAAAGLFAIATVAGCGPTRQELGRNMGPTPEPPLPSVARHIDIDPALVSQANREIRTDLQLKVTSGADEPAKASLRQHALEAVAQTHSLEFGDDVIIALHDARDPVVRFAAAMAAGQVGLSEAKPTLLTMVNDPSINVRVAVCYALHELGDARYTHYLEKTAVNSDPRVRANTAMVMGLIGNHSAMAYLRIMRADPSLAVRQEAAGALWRLKDGSGQSDLLSFCISATPEDRMFGMMALAAPRDPIIREHIRANLTSDWLAVNLVAARAFAMLGGDPADLGYVVACQQVTSKDATLRGLAALALGAIGRSDSQSAIRKLLADPHPEVRLAAAIAMLQVRNAAEAPVEPGVPQTANSQVEGSGGK